LRPTIHITIVVSTTRNFHSVYGTGETLAHIRLHKRATRNCDENGPPETCSCNDDIIAPGLGVRDDHRRAGAVPDRPMRLERPPRRKAVRRMILRRDSKEKADREGFFFHSTALRLRR